MDTVPDAQQTSPEVAPYDALLLVSFGGPEQPDDVVPFLENVTRGRGIPRERLEEVGEHYFLFGGRSPINDQNREFLAALRAALAELGLTLPVYWGNRNWDPYLRDTLAQMTADGVQRAACFVTSAYSSWSSCRQYRENLFDAVEGLEGAPRLDKLRHYFNHPGFVGPVVDGALAAIDDLPAEARDGARLVFVTHSIPTAMAQSSGAPADGGAYERQHRDVATVVAAAVAERTGVERAWDLVYCSRSGSPQTPWLEPDVNDHLTAIAGEVPAVVVVPIGFVSDHMEVIYDLDTEAKATAAELGLPFRRSATAGTDPRFVATAVDLLLERADVERARESGRPDAGIDRPALGALGAFWDRCPPDCCANPRGRRPALCGAEE